MHLKMEFFYASMLYINIYIVSFIDLPNYRLINKLQPGAVGKICTQGGGFKLRENVSAFRK
jgi:hypothetical protein